MLNQMLYYVAVVLPVVLLSLTVHEYAHAAAASALGDPTPKWRGRLSLNPLVHLDPIGTLTLVLTQRFGWAKPVPVNPAYFRDWRKGMMIVGVAGPLANIGLAFVLAVPFRLNLSMPVGLAEVLLLGAWVNLGLAAFNLIPIPPLDGSRLLLGILKGRYIALYAQLEQAGPFILLLLVLTRSTSFFILPLLNLLGRIVMGG